MTKQQIKALVADLSDIDLDELDAAITEERHRREDQYLAAMKSREDTARSTGRFAVPTEG